MTPSVRPRKTTSPGTTPPRAAAAPVVDPAAREALAWLHGARFLTTASRLDQLPQGDLPEIAFVGRSNAGKSSAINTLAQARQLAFASKTPGRTQHINLFSLGPRDAPDAYLADLPGYGYAAVDRGKKLVWQQVMADYLAIRRALGGVVLMVDSRHGFTPLDRQLLEFIGQRVRTGEVCLLVLLTKADKLTKTEARAAVLTAQEVLAEFATESSDVAVTLFSALRRTGVEDVATALRAFITKARPVAAGETGLPAGLPDEVMQELHAPSTDVAD